MCVGDLRKARLVRAVYRKFDITGGASTLVMEANQNRVGWLMSTHDVTDFMIAFDADPVVAEDIVIPRDKPPFEISLIEHGDLVTKSVFAIASIGLTGIGLVEFFLPESVLAEEGIQDFNA